MPGQRFELRPGGDGDARGASTTYPGLAGDLDAGDRILLADGAVELTVSSVEREVVLAECVRGGRFGSGQGVNVPAERLGLPPVTDRDRNGLALALELGADFIAQSFVRAPEDVVELRGLMADRAIPIVAKIETRPAVDDIDRIVEQADALMIARGDLGVELPMEEIAMIQKELVRTARAAAKPAVVATQMLESMMNVPRPTRAEATDVANAVLDGADAVMLSGETAIGRVSVRGGIRGDLDRGVRGVAREGFPREPAPVPPHERRRCGRPRGGHDAVRGPGDRGGDVLHGDRADGEAPVVRTAGGSGVRLRAARRGPSVAVPPLGGRGVARDRRRGHRRPDLLDG